MTILHDFDNTIGSQIGNYRQLGSAFSVGNLPKNIPAHRRTYGKLVCECVLCGKKVIIGVYCFQKATGKCKSCAATGLHTKHGMVGTKEYQTWKSIRARCNNPNGVFWNRYGGRGIKVFSDWDRADGFPSFYAYIGPAPSKDHEIDRINNDGNYEPGNVRWVTHRENSRNRGNAAQVTVQGITKPLCEWLDVTGLPRTVYYNRIYRGWSQEKAILEPKQVR